MDPPFLNHGAFSFLLRHHGNSHARKLTAAMAMPTPKSTPARTRFEPPSPKAKVRPETTIATRESPRAMVLVKACCKTVTAFSQGEFAWPNARAANVSATSSNARPRIEAKDRQTHKENFFIKSWPS